MGNIGLFIDNSIFFSRLETDQSGREGILCFAEHTSVIVHNDSSLCTCSYNTPGITDHNAHKRFFKQELNLEPSPQRSMFKV